MDILEKILEYKKDFSKLGLRYLIGYIILSIIQVCVMLIAFFCQPEWQNNINAILLLSALPMYLAGMPILIALVSRLPGKAPEKHKMKFGQMVLAFIMCIAIMYASNFIGVILVSIIEALKGGVVDNTVAELASNADIRLIFVYMVLLAPVFEEFIFRKLLIDRTLKYGQGTAIVMSGVMFGLYHGNISQCIYATTLGMFLAFLYVKTGNLKITIGFHMLVNFMGSIVSVLVMKLINISELQEIVEKPMEEQAALLMQHVMENLAGYIVYMLYACVLMGLMVAGIIMLIVFRKRFAIEPGEVALPKGQRFNVMFVNVGMILYSLFFVGVIIAQLLG